MDNVRQLLPIWNEKERRRRILLACRISVLLIFILCTVVLVRHFLVRRFSGYEVLAETGLYHSLSGCSVEGDVLLAYSNDGAKAVSKRGELLWEMSYRMENPKLAGCGEVAAVADIGGTSVYIMDKDRVTYHYEVVYPIVKHEVAGQGVTAVLLDNGSEDYIQLYDKNGTLRVDINTITKKDGIPVDIALSSDGKKLVTLYMTYEGNAMLCKVTFYHAGETGRNYISNIVGQKIYEENRLVFDVGFLEDDILYVLLENGFALYRMSEVPQLICEKTLAGSYVDMALAEDGLYIITEDTSKQRMMTFYNSKGDAAKTWKTVPEYESVMATEDEVIFFSPRSVTIYRSNRSLKFHKVFEQSLEGIFPAGDNRYFLVDTSKVQAIKLSGKANDKEDKSSAHMSGRAFSFGKQGGLE